MTAKKLAKLLDKMKSVEVSAVEALKVIEWLHTRARLPARGRDAWEAREKAKAACDAAKALGMEMEK